MKKILFSTILILILLNCKAQWKVIYSSSSITINSIFFTSQDTGFVVGENGLFMRTFNSGQTWATLNNIGNFKATSIFFFNNGVGYIGGSSGLSGTNPVGIVLKSTDFGNTWVTQSSGTNSSAFNFKPISSIYFTSPNIGYVISNKPTSYSQNAIIGTTNGGTTWGSVSGAPASKGGNSITFVRGNPSKGYIVDNGSLVIRIYIGSSWPQTTSTTNTSAQNCVFAANDSIAYSVSNGGYIAKTINSGANWTETHPISNDLNGVFFIDKNVGHVVGNNTALKTTDGGLTWLPQITYNTLNNAFATPFLKSIYFINDSVGFTSGNGLILRYSDNGLSTNLSENKFNQINISLSPNPSNGKINLNYKSNLTQTTMFELTNILGDILYSQLITSEKENNIILPKLSNGTYYYRIKMGDEVLKSDKVIILE